MGRCKFAYIKYNNRKVGDTMKEKLEKIKIRKNEKRCTGSVSCHEKKETP